MSEKLQKILANAGFGSRRAIEAWIKEGRVKLNGRVAELGARATLEESIEIDGKAIRLNRDIINELPNVIIYHKPAGQVCTQSDPEGRPTVFENLPRIRGQRWIMVGRLDINTAGLLLFTTNGELANRLMHPRHQVEREYAVRVFGEVDKTVLTNLQQGVMLEDGMARFNKIIDAGGTGSNHWYHVILSEGRNREVRRLWESQAVTVSRLIRVRFGDIHLPRDLRQGAVRALDPTEVENLMIAVGLS